MSFCTEITLCQARDYSARFRPLYCRSWNCDICRPKRRWQLRQDGARGQPDTFITLTSKKDLFRSQHAAALALIESWREIRRLAALEARRNIYKRPRPYGSWPDASTPDGPPPAIQKQVRLPEKNLQFLAVIEVADQGMVHLHILARTLWLDQKWLAYQMAAMMGSPVCDVRRIRSKKEATAYAVKYCGKAPHKIATLKRYWRSLDYITTKKEAPRPNWFDGAPWFLLNRSFFEMRRWAFVEWDGSKLEDGWWIAFGDTRQLEKYKIHKKRRHRA